MLGKKKRHQETSLDSYIGCIPETNPFLKRFFKINIEEKRAALKKLAASQLKVKHF